MWIVAEGLHPGDRVVVEGVQKVHDGAPVNPKSWTPPPADASATPSA
jgi:membrane fusion protein (multidrug efflux system)